MEATLAAVADAPRSERFLRLILTADADDDGAGSEVEPELVGAAVAAVGIDAGPPGLGGVATELQRLRRRQPKPVDVQIPDSYLRPESLLHRPVESCTVSSAIGLVGRSLP